MKPEEESSTSTPSNLPAGFFSKGGPSIEEDEEDEQQPEPKQQEPEADAGVEGEKGVDEDLDEFLSSLAEPDEGSAPTAAAPASTTVASTSAARAKKRSTYKDMPEGVASYSAAPVLVNGDAPAEEEEPEAEETPAERRARLAREENEEILQRLEEEQRAQ